MPQSKAPRLALLLLLCLAATATAARTAAKKSKEGTYDEPVADNKIFKKFKFTVAATNEQTSFTPARGDTTDDPNLAGSMGTIVSQLFDDEDGENQIGTAVWTRDVIQTVDGVMTRQLIATFQFGDESDGYTDGSITVQVVTKRRVPENEYVEWTGIVNGGSGIYKAATGTVSLNDAVQFDPNLVISAVYSVELYVPNLPKN